MIYYEKVIYIMSFKVVDDIYPLIEISSMYGQKKTQLFPCAPMV